MSILWRYGQVIASRSEEEEMRVREVIPFGKSDEEMETRERGKKAELWREWEADRGKDIFRGVFTLSYRLFIICILDLSKSGEQLHIAVKKCHFYTCVSPHKICLLLQRWPELHFSLHQVLLKQGNCNSHFYSDKKH